MSTTAVNGATSSASVSQALKSSSKLGQQQFLKLLMTELSNQNPLDPQDDKAFLAEMAQFSTVEGVTTMNTQLGQLQAASLIGKTVDAMVTTDGASNSISGIVKGIKFNGDSVSVNVNGLDIPVSQILNVS